MVQARLADVEQSIGDQVDDGEQGDLNVEWREEDRSPEKRKYGRIEIVSFENLERAFEVEVFPVPEMFSDGDVGKLQICRGEGVLRQSLRCQRLRKKVYLRAESRHGVQDGKEQRGAIPL